MSLYFDMLLLFLAIMAGCWYLGMELWAITSREMEGEEESREWSEEG